MCQGSHFWRLRANAGDGHVVRGAIALAGGTPGPARDMAPLSARRSATRSSAIACIRPQSPKVAALTHHSPKLHLTAGRGFALHESRHAGFRREWHTHDCSMLLWTRAGRLRSVWENQPDAQQPGPVAATLVRGGAVLLPAATRHFTAAEAGRQHHGELYLPADRLHGPAPYGALRLDGAALAMLEVLLTPGLAPASAELLVRGGTTLVIYMGMSRLTAIRDGLLAAGMRADMLAAVVMHAGGADERSWTGTVQTLADALTAGLASPAVVLVGGVVAEAMPQAMAMSSVAP